MNLGKINCRNTRKGREQKDKLELCRSIFRIVVNHNFNKNQKDCVKANATGLITHND